MKLDPGFKQTNAGVIPEGWESKPLRSVVSKGRLGGNYSNQNIASSFPLIKMGNLDRGNFDLSKVEFITDGIIPEYQHRLVFGDVLFNTRNTLSLVGKVAMWRDELPVAYYNSNLMRLEFDTNEVCSNEYANYALNTAGSIARLRAMATGTTSVAAIYTRDLMGLEFILPPKSEQRAIAEALGDGDALLGALDQLIAKKRLIKRGAMQDLLTAKRRLPGFSGEWDNIRLSEHGKFLSGSGFPLSCQGNKSGDLPFFKVSDFSGADNGSVLTRANHYIDQTVQRKIGARVFPPRAIAFAKIGAAIFLERKRMVAQASCLDNNMAAFVLEDENFSADLILAKFQEFSLGALVSSTALPAISSSDLKTIEFYLPKSLQEQQAISNLLTDIDTEIQALEQRRTKTAALKQGMMQELLTGRTRLV